MAFLFLHALQPGERWAVAQVADNEHWPRYQAGEHIVVDRSVPDDFSKPGDYLLWHEGDIILRRVSGLRPGWMLLQSYAEGEADAVEQCAKWLSVGRIHGRWIAAGDIDTRCLS